MNYSALLLLLAVTAVAQPAAKPAPATPTLSDNLKLKFFKAQSELMQASEQAKQTAQTAQQKQAALQEAVKEMQSACGVANQLELDKSGEPACVVKVAATEKAK